MNTKKNMKNMKKINSSLILAILIVCILLSAIGITAFTKIAYAQEHQNSLILGSYDADFFSGANTYNAQIKESTSAVGTDTVGYNMTVNNNNQVSSQDAQVTFITHGLNSSPSAWGPMNDEKSIMRLLMQKANANVYLAGINESNIFYLKQYNTNNSQYSTNNVENNTVIDNSKHTIILFDGNNAEEHNDIIYNEFNIVASEVVLDLQALDSENRLPKVNLIGHSRGGLTNMQYALDHPDLVDSIFSLSTPYIGSSSASLDNYLLNGMATENSHGEDDITNPDVFMSYVNRWNNNYDELYNHINVHALGGYQSLDMLLYQILYFFIEDMNGVEESVLKATAKSLNIALSNLAFYLLTPTQSSYLILSNAILDVFVKNIPDFEATEELESGLLALLEILTVELVYNPLELSFDWHNDTLVDLTSQLGSNKLGNVKYNGFNTYEKRFGIYDNYDLTKASSYGAPPVTHSIVTRDLEMLTYIVDKIDMTHNKNSKYLTRNIDDRNVAIIGYIGKTHTNELTIPSTIEFLDSQGNIIEKTVSEIGEGAFTNSLSKSTDITKIIIPNTVKTIASNAFSNNESLVEIVFAENSTLEYIEQRAFCDTNLENFTLPSTLINIEDEVFFNTGITSITGNSNYIWQNNILVKQNVTNINKKIAVYVKPNVTSISFPNDVAIISSSLFKNNKSIRNVYLNQVEYIGSMAFSNSNITNIYNYHNVIDCDVSALLNTPWYENQSSDYIILGKVLLQYMGNESIVEIPNNIHRVGANSFNNNMTTQVVLSDSINSLGVSAFSGLIGLDSIIFASDLPPMLDGECFNESVTLYVKETRLTEYQNNIYFINLPNNITKKEITITFKDVDDNVIGTKKEYYGSKLDNVVTAPTIKGEDFISWQYNNVNIKVNDMINYYNSVSLKAYYEIAQYQVTMGEEILTLEYGEEIMLQIPSENGKTFKGWYDQSEGGNLIIGTTGICVWNRTIDNDALYPQFDNILYTITYNYKDADKIFEMPTTFTVDNPINKSELVSPQKFGYVFVKWNYNNQTFTNTEGIYKNIELTAQWEGQASTANTTLTINDAVSIVNMPSSTSPNYKIYIGSNVKSVTFIGSVSNEYKLNIIFNARTTAVILGFKNMNFKASPDISKDAIQCESTVKVYITYDGINQIKGGDGEIASGNGNDGGNGGYAIKVHSLSIVAFDFSSQIKIYGGNGGNGSNGYNGTNGKNGTKCPSGSIFKPIKGENGGNGGNGYTGGNGGDGGYAIFTVTSDITVHNNSSYFVKGGNGGDGGDGGNGGAGGDGADDTSANPFNGVGDPGDGGDGEDGGKNGEAGQGENGLNWNVLTAEFGEKGLDGSNGKGGTAGEGGHHGTVGSDGDNGKDGSSGSDGVTIVTSVSTSLCLSSQQLNTIIELPYIFSTEFMNSYLN